jgi:predicted RNA-binding protein with PUA-like domain
MFQFCTRSNPFEKYFDPAYGDPDRRWKKVSVWTERTCSKLYFLNPIRKKVQQ